MFTPQKTIRLTLSIVFGLSMISQSHTAWCAPPSVTLPSNEDKPTLKVLQISEIESEVALQAKVTFTAKSQSLSDLLLDLQTQSKVTLTPTPDALKNSVKITAYVQDLPLSKVLLGLSRLYGVRWTKTADSSLAMLPSDKGEFETGLMQLGNIDGFEGRFLASQRKSSEHMHWPQEVVKYVSEEDLLKGSTPPVSVLPPELLSKIRKEKEQVVALRLLEMYHAAMEASIDEYILRAEVPKPFTSPDGKIVSPPPSIIVHTQEGKTIASLSPQPEVKPSKSKSLIPNLPTRNIPGPT
ncbi:hypothetical protein IAD21_02415 [Abditibacteriota bacterium]|nr:hypothetical protein IAD21_02415 [Abditibacteriota bacterium]